MDNWYFDVFKCSNQNFPDGFRIFQKSPKNSYDLGKAEHLAIVIYSSILRSFIHVIFFFIYSIIHLGNLGTYFHLDRSTYSLFKHITTNKNGFRNKKPFPTSTHHQIASVGKSNCFNWKDCKQTEYELELKLSYFLL